MRGTGRALLVLVALTVVARAAGALPVEEHGRIVSLTTTHVALDTGLDCSFRTHVHIGLYKVGDYATLFCTGGKLDAVHRHVIVADRRSGALRLGAPDIGNVSCAVADGHGGWYVGLSEGPQGVALVGRMRADGRLDPSWLEPLTGSSVVAAVALQGTTLYAAGGAVIHPSRVYAFDTRTRKKLWTSAGFHGDIGVHELAATPTAVYAAGGFTRAGTAKRTDLAALDPHTGKLLAWHTVPPFGEYADVESIAVSSSRVYAGGPFGLAALSVQTGEVIRSFNPKVHASDVTSIAVHRQTVFIGTASDAIAFDATTGAPTRTFDNVAKVAVDNATLYLGGKNVLYERKLAGLSPTSWAPDVGDYANVEFIVPSGGNVLVGGDFDESRG